MFSPVQDSLSFWGTVMQGDPNQSQGILSTNKHYYADTFQLWAFKYIKKSLEDILLLLQLLLYVKSPVYPPKTWGFRSQLTINNL